MFPKGHAPTQKSGAPEIEFHRPTPCLRGAETDLRRALDISAVRAA
jgi:hypothetical protein